MKRIGTILAVQALLVLAGPALAQVQKDVAMIGNTQPPNFAPQITGDACVNSGAPIPDNSAVGGTAALVVTGGGTISAVDPLEVGMEVTHTWVGDLSMRLTHVDTGTSVLVYDRPGFMTPGFGCAGNDVDALLSDDATSPVETACMPSAVPAISGTFQPNNPLSAFNGESVNGTWTLFVRDHAAGDVGTIDVFCLNGPLGGTTGGTTTGGTPTPATSEWGVLLLIALFLGVSTFQLRHRLPCRARASSLAPLPCRPRTTPPASGS